MERFNRIVDKVIDKDFNIRRYINSVFTSNTYLLWKEGLKDCLIIDCGDTEKLLNDITELGLHLTSVLLTHGHFDHIYGLNNLLHVVPDVNIYTSEHGKDCLLSDKLNMSRYHESPFIFSNPTAINVIDEGLLEVCGIKFNVLFTPGHNPGCITYFTNNTIFTGDSFIPDVRVVTNLPRCNREQAELSMEKILKLAMGKTLYPGHGGSIKM